MAEDEGTGTGEQETGAEGTGTQAETQGDLGDAGKKALAEERKARRDAERARKAAEDELQQLRSSLEQGKQADEAKAEAEQIRRDAEKTATAKANERILRAEIRAAAAGKLTDPADALAYLDLAQFEVGDDGSVDAGDIAEAISDLIKRKPYLAAKAQGFQGSGDGGARTSGSSPKQVTDAELKTMTPGQIVKARSEGRLAKVMGG